MASKKKNKKSGGSVLSTLLILICLGVIAFAAFKLGSALLEYYKAAKEYDHVREEVVTDSKGGTAAEGVIESEKELKAPIDVDWDKLKKINPDVVGWIYIGALDLSYPVAKGVDENGKPSNEFYLHHTIEKTYNFAGTIFVECRNKGDFTDPNTIVYGHNMNDGSMFGSLKKLPESDKLKKDPYFWILTPEHNYRYEIFDISSVPVDSDVYTLFSGVDNKFVEYAKKWDALNTVELPEVEFNLNSRIVTLSTCTSSEAERRIVQGVREATDAETIESQKAAIEADAKEKKEQQRLAREEAERQREEQAFNEEYPEEIVTEENDDWNDGEFEPDVVDEY